METLSEEIGARRPDSNFALAPGEAQRRDAFVARNTFSNCGRVTQRIDFIMVPIYVPVLQVLLSQGRQRG